MIKPNMHITHKEQGLVLFVSLIALVVMSLAAVALIRSVDTNSQIAGNLAFKQNAIISSNVGLEAMADTIGSQGLMYGVTDHAGDGYYAVCTRFDLPLNDPDYVECGAERLTDRNQWTDANSQLANGEGINNGVDQYGNTIRYIVERMSTDDDGDDKIDVSKTLLAKSKSRPGSSEKGPGEEQGRTLYVNVGTVDPIYRITLRIEGVKDSVSYIQAYFS